MFTDWIVIRPELLDPESGEGLGVPDPGVDGLAAAPTVGGGEWVGPDGRSYYVCRVRCEEGQRPQGLAWATCEAFRAAKPTLWARYGMQARLVTVLDLAPDGTEVARQVEVQPQVAVFL